MREAQATFEAATAELAEAEQKREELLARSHEAKALLEAEPADNIDDEIERLRPVRVDLAAIESVLAAQEAKVDTLRHRVEKARRTVRLTELGALRVREKAAALTVYRLADELLAALEAVQSIEREYRGDWTRHSGGYLPGVAARIADVKKFRQHIPRSLRAEVKAKTTQNLMDSLPEGS